MILRIFTRRAWSRVEAIRRVSAELREDYAGARFVRSGKHDGEFRWMEFEVTPKKYRGMQFEGGKFRWVYR